MISINSDEVLISQNPLVGFEENRRVEENDLSCRDDHTKRGLMMLDVVKFHLMMNDVHFVFLRTLKLRWGLA